MATTSTTSQSEIEHSILFLVKNATGVGHSNGCHNGTFELLKEYGYCDDPAEYARITDSMAERGLIDGCWRDLPLAQRGGPIDLLPSGQAQAS